MLISEPPYMIIDGVSVFTDHIDKLQLYFLPIIPLLETTEVNGSQLPMFSLIEFSDGADNSGGLLNFTTSLGIDSQRLEDIASQAAELLGLDDTPRLSPVPIIDGSARLILLGRASAENEDEVLVVDTSFNQVDDEGGSSRFVQHMSHPAKPSMYGNMNASFSAELSRDGAEIMRQALDGIIVPAVVMYELTFASLRPAYNVSVSADWERVQKHLDEKFGVNLLVFSSSIEKIVDELVEEKLITIEADTFITAEDEDAALLANKERALIRVQEMVTETFFTPSLNPWKPPVDKWDKALGAVERLAHINPMGKEDALFSYNKVDYTRIDKKKLNVSFSERSAIRRTIYPQAHLNGMVGELTASGLDIDDVVTRVRLGDPWYESRKLDVFNRADFERDGITSIRVELDYEGERETVLFHSTDTPDETLVSGNIKHSRAWPSRVEGDRMIMPVSLQYTVDFNDTVTETSIGRAESATSVVTGEVLEIDPVGDGLYRRHVVSAGPSRAFPWDRYSSIEVWFGHELEDGTIDSRSHQRIVNDSSDENTVVADVSYAYTTTAIQSQDCYFRVKFLGSQSGDVAEPWRLIDGDFVTLADPFPSKRKLSVVGALPWADYTSVFVDLEMRDASGSVVARESLDLSETRTSALFVADLPDPKLQEVDYRVTAIKTDGTVIETGKSVTRKARVIITDKFIVQRAVRVGLHDIDFQRERIDKVIVRLQHDDMANGLRSTAELVFDDPQDSAFFEYEYIDDSSANYQVNIESVSTSGTRRSLPEPLVTSDLVLELDLP